MKEIARHILGYIIGFTIFVAAIPLSLYKLCKSDVLFCDIGLIGSETLRWLLSSILFLVGILFAAWSNLYLLRIGKGGPVDAFGISISPQTKKLVTTGPYHYSRNPMVLGALLAYLSVVVFFNSMNGLIVVFVSIILMVFFLKRSEEKRLIKDFGMDYLEYRKKVPMIFPFKILNYK